MQWPWLHHYQWLASTAGCCGAEHVLAFSAALVLLLAAQRGASVPLMEYPLLHAGREASAVLSAV